MYILKHMFIYLLCMFVLCERSISVEYRLAWLAPESTCINTSARSTIGALQTAINTVQTSILTQDTIRQVSSIQLTHLLINFVVKVQIMSLF